MGTRGDMYPLGLCIALYLSGTVAQNNGTQGTTEDCIKYMLCPSNAKCVNNTHCTCLHGYRSGKDRFFTDPMETCDDINECLGPSLADCGPNTNCNNTAGTYFCTCINGYEPSSGKGQFMNASENTCQDIDECRGSSPADCGPHANCTNLPGSYSCSCIHGYETRSGKDKFTHARENTCQDIDECLGLTGVNCGPHANCTNVPGSYSCTCIHGYEPSSGKAKFMHATGDTCQDIDECQQNATVCEPHGNCINMPGSYRCKCSWGFGKSQKDASKICTDIDECHKIPNICGPNATCINTNGSYRCECRAGYVPSNRNTTLCQELQVPSINSSAEFEGIKETCRNFSLQVKRSSGNSSFCSFFNSTLEILISTCGDGSATLSLEATTRSFNSLLNSTSLWDGRDKQEVGSAVTVLLQSLELAALATALRSPERTTQNVTTESLAIQTRLVTGDCSRDSDVFTLRAHKDTMEVHCDTVIGAATQGLGAAAFISYSTLDSIISARHLSKGNLRAGGKLEKSHLNSRVVSGAVGDGRPINLSRPTNFTLRHRQAKKQEEEALCVYWKVVAESSSWSPEGCTTGHTNSTHTTCRCDHLSSFAVLMAPTTVTVSPREAWITGLDPKLRTQPLAKLSPEALLGERLSRNRGGWAGVTGDSPFAVLQESDPLTIITYVGLTLSLLCLFLAILTFLLCHSIRNVSTSLHLQLCLCLFLADLLFLTVETRTGSRVACAVIAGLLHYLFLACFSWMFLEGLHLFLTVQNLKVVNYTSASRFKKRFMYPFGYGFPALVVAISAAVNHKGYGTSKHCWLSLDRGFHWNFLGPVCAIILINIMFFALTLWILRNRLSSLNADVSTLRDHRLLTFKAIAQLFILGCTWSLGLLQVGPAATVMAYLFTIVNSLQGAFIFLVHCLLNRQVREEYRRWIKGFRTSRTKSQTSNLSMSAVPTTSTKTE
ncbi:adhesion G protein-coupled receptor E3-like isoform X4 [Dermochelys coriacea]|uniref:adhesion G protein-coupled receptor E3-like isoform X4 n=1 Tax=Dermochelys coriacea TaxID=27794 RepID=UPI001CA7C983|nr:adhesion G protein-coupled receptor E3-like isoform X4 [Dermochelys coriacea]